MNPVGDEPDKNDRHADEEVAANIRIGGLLRVVGAAGVGGRLRDDVIVE